MSATSRVLAALTLVMAVLLLAPPAMGLTLQGPAPARVADAVATADSAPVLEAAEGTSRLPAIATRGWVVADLDSGEILAMQRPYEPLRPASTLKLLTALTVAPRLAPDQPYRAGKDDETAVGNRVVLHEGLEYTVKDLLHAALLPSANDAAEALARANGGIDITVDQMNAEAARLGATNTTVRNPSGLDADGQFTTAFDLAIIGRAALNHPEIASYLALRTVDFPGRQTASGQRVIRPIYNLNRMLSDGYDGAIGGKPGYTTKAGRTMVAAAERGGRRLVVSLMRIGGNTYRTPEILLDWAFANIDTLSPVGRLPDPSSPAPHFDRAVVALPEIAATDGGVDRAVGVSPGQSDASTSSGSSQSASLPRLSRVLTLLTLLAAVLVGLRARVYWLAHRTRVTAAGDRRSGQGMQPRPAQRLGPPADRVTVQQRGRRTSDESLIGASR